MQRLPPLAQQLPLIVTLETKRFARVDKGCVDFLLVGCKHTTLALPQPDIQPRHGQVWLAMHRLECLTPVQISSSQATPVFNHTNERLGAGMIETTCSSRNPY